MESDLSPLANSTVFEGYRAFNYTAATETNHFNGQNLTLADSGVFSIGSASGISTRSLGGIPFTNNAIYLALRIRNSTTNVLDQCTIKYSFNQNTSSGFTNSTWMTLSTATGFLNSLKQGSWTDRLTNIPTTAGIASYQILASPTSVSTNLILTNLSILPVQDLWIRWTISTTSPNQPLLLAIDNVGVTNFVTKSQNIITFSPLTSTATYGDASLPLNASASSGLPVSFVSSDTLTNKQHVVVCHSPFKYTYECEKTSLDIQTYKNTYYKLDQIDKPLKGFSSYKLPELVEICNKLSLDLVNRATLKKKTKQELYESIIQYF
jgi:hypothetical protein